MIEIFLIWLAFIFLEIISDWYMITILKISPNHTHSFWLRFGAGLLWFWISGFIFRIEFQRWILIPIMEAFTFWFIFDYGLNLARKMPLLHLGTSKIDTWQKNTLGELPWFWFKFILCGASIAAYFYGLDKILNY